MLALDANTISYFFRGDPLVVQRMCATTPAQLAVPSVVVYELRYGLLRLPEAAARPRLDALAKFLQPLQVLDFANALDDCDKCLKLDPKFVRGHVRKGNVFFGTREYHKVRDCCCHYLR